VSDIQVTVVVCVYNGEKYLAQTLESVAQQTGFGSGGEGIEVIVIDDRSNDRSVETIKQFIPVLEGKGFSVRPIFHSENIGSVRSYEEGATAARGKYFKILDHDDVLVSAGALSEPVAFMESMEMQGIPVGIVFSKTLYIDEAGVVFGEKRFPFPFLSHEAPDGLIPRNWGQLVLIFSPLYPFVHGASIVRKACWRELSVDYLAKHGTSLFDVHLALHAMHSRRWRVGYLRSPSLQYRIHESNLTQTTVKRRTWTDILNAEYENLYGKGALLIVIKSWTKLVQTTKGIYHRLKGADAFKAIAVFGRRK